MGEYYDYIIIGNKTPIHSTLYRTEFSSMIVMNDIVMYLCNIRIALSGSMICNPPRF